MLVSTVGVPLMVHVLLSMDKPVGNAGEMLQDAPVTSVMLVLEPFPEFRFRLNVREYEVEEELAYTVYWPATWEAGGVPVIVPVNASSDNPAGRLGETSQVISPTSISVEISDAERTASYTYKSSRMPSNAIMLPEPDS